MILCLILDYRDKCKKSFKFAIKSHKFIISKMGNI